MTAAPAARRLLFVPVSGPSGSGELQRSLIIASGVRRRWPQIDIRFAASRAAPRVSDLPYPTVLLPSSPTRCTPEIRRLLADLRPDLVIFDGAARVVQLRTAREMGAATIFVSSRPSGRTKGLRWRRLRHLDETWWTQPQFLEPALSRWEELKLRIAGATRPIRIGPVLEHPADDSIAVPATPFAVFCLGLSRDERSRRAVEAFDAVADQLYAATGLHAVTIGMDGHQPEQRPHVTSLPLQRNAQLMAWLHSASLAFTNGGSLLLQSLSLGTVTVAVAVGRDQPARIDACVRAGIAATAAIDATALLDCACRLMNDPGRRDAMRSAARAAFPADGLERALERIAAWLDRAGDEPAGHRDRARA